jgi:hypothetical protein
MNPSVLHDGRYMGIWGGRFASLLSNGKAYKFETSVFIKTPAAPCWIVIDKDTIQVNVI